MVFETGPVGETGGAGGSAGDETLRFKIPAARTAIPQQSTIQRSAQPITMQLRSEVSPGVLSAMLLKAR